MQGWGRGTRWLGGAPKCSGSCPPRRRRSRNLGRGSWPRFQREGRPSGSLTAGGCGPTQRLGFTALLLRLRSGSLPLGYEQGRPFPFSPGPLNPAGTSFLEARTSASFPRSKALLRGRKGRRRREGRDRSGKVVGLWEEEQEFQNRKDRSPASSPMKANFLERRIIVL